MNQLRSMGSQLRIIVGQDDGRASPFTAVAVNDQHDHSDFECSCFSHASTKHRPTNRRVREPMRHRLLRKR